MSTHVPSRIPSHKFDPAEQFRAEIEERTAIGETCEQIAVALRAQGVDLTNKTVSRRRVEWGLRRRATSKLKGTKAKNPRPRKAGSKHGDAGERKVEIQARTERGETAEQIATALMAQGCELKKGAGTILRLQTFWGFIPPDEARARGRKKKDPTNAAVMKAKAPKVSKREMAREANMQQQTQTMHYPTNCNFGPKKRVNGAGPDDGSQDYDMQSDYEAGSHPAMTLDDQSLPYQPANPSISVAAEIMSVEFLVDLATSTLGAANHLKDTLLAYQTRRPVPGALSGTPPKLEDLTTARRKVREAAAVMHDLATEPTTEGAAG